MHNLSNVQKNFFEKLKQIQDEVVNVSLCKVNDDLESTLFDVTYETMYRILELLDGYNINEYRFTVVEEETGAPINENIQLHDVCADFLKSE